MVEAYTWGLLKLSNSFWVPLNGFETVGYSAISNRRIEQPPVWAVNFAGTPSLAGDLGR